MHSGLIFLESLPDEDVEWLFATGEEREFAANELLISEGASPEFVYIVLRGLLGVFAGNPEEGLLRILGPGELVGEMSLVEEAGAAASIHTVEKTQALVISRRDLAKRVSENPSFGSRFFRAMAKTLSSRLRLSNRRVYEIQATRKTIKVSSPTRTRVTATLEDLKETLRRADLSALENDEVIPSSAREEVTAKFKELVTIVNDLLGDDSHENVFLKDELGQWVQRELFPFVLMTDNGGRWYSKPRGYAGDYLTLDKLYKAIPKGAGRLGPLLDNCFLDLPTAIALRQRRKLLCEEIGETLARKRQGGESLVRVTCIGSGPASEMFDVYRELESKDSLEFTIVDIDRQALAFVEDRVVDAGLAKQIKFVPANLVYLARGKDELEVPPQDLIYCSSLADNLSDKHLTVLMDIVHNALKPRGHAVIGALHPANPGKAIMDYVFDWRLIHRTESQLNELLTKSRFGGPSIMSWFDDERVNLFVKSMKAA